MSQQWVYFIKPVGAEGPIKIGCSSAPTGRMEHFLCWSPVRLEIIGQVPGSFSDERMVHRRFAGQHSHREWFHASTDLLQAIATAVETGSLAHIAPLPDQGSIRKNSDRRIKPWSAGRRQYQGLIIRLTKAKRLQERLQGTPLLWKEGTFGRLYRWDYDTEPLSPELNLLLSQILATPEQFLETPEWEREAA